MAIYLLKFSLRQGLAIIIQGGLKVSSEQSSGLRFPSPGITGTYYLAQPVLLIMFLLIISFPCFWFNTRKLTSPQLHLGRSNSEWLRRLLMTEAFTTHFLIKLAAFVTVLTDGKHKSRKKQKTDWLRKMKKLAEKHQKWQRWFKNIVNGK